MPAYKDKERGTWYCKFYYSDWQGERKAKLKRGFTRQKDAKEWERDFLDRLQASPQMTFSSLVDLYLADMSARLRVSTMDTKKNIIETKLTPFFGKLKLEAITPAVVRQWQNGILGEGYKDTYAKTIHNQLSAVFNYAVKYYGLAENPCHKAGSIGKKHAKDMEFWTRDEYGVFILAHVEDQKIHMAFQVLYWCGLRVGELLALAPGDIDFEGKTLTVNKSFQRLKGEDLITEPKTPKGNRVIALPDFLCSELKAYLPKLYEPSRIFPLTKHVLSKSMKKGCEMTGAKKIRVHDLRHSHASLLIELGFSPLLIAERLGHENIETTLNTYAHLYPHKQTELAKRLEILGNSVIPVSNGELNKPES